MSLKEALGGGGVLLGAMTLIQLSPLKINPWSKLWGWLKKGFRAVCRATNAEVLLELGAVRNQLREVREEIATTKKQLASHVTMDDRRTADSSRARILHFNNELLRRIGHTKEEFVEILAEIDAYERYCEKHPDYPNNRAVLAIETIRENYKTRLQKHDFLFEMEGKEMPYRCPEAYRKPGDVSLHCKKLPKKCSWCGHQYQCSQTGSWENSQQARECPIRAAEDGKGACHGTSRRYPAGR